MALRPELRLQAMIRSLGEVIIPALPAEETLARDQALILLGSLRMLAEQQSRAYDFEMAELREHLALAEGLAAASAGGPETLAARDDADLTIAVLGPVAKLAVPSQAQLSRMALEAKVAAERLVDAVHEDGAPEFRAAAERLVMAQAARQIERERRWTEPAGFDPGAAELTPLDDILARGRR